MLATCVLCLTFLHLHGLWSVHEMGQNVDGTGVKFISIVLEGQSLDRNGEG